MEAGKGKKKTLVIGKMVMQGGASGDQKNTMVLQRVDASEMFGWTKQTSGQMGFNSSANFTKTYHDTYHLSDT